MRVRKQNRIASSACVGAFFFNSKRAEVVAFCDPKVGTQITKTLFYQPHTRKKKPTSRPFFSGQQLIVVSPIVANFLLCVLNRVIKMASTGNYKCPYNVTTSAD